MLQLNMSVKKLIRIHFNILLTETKANEKILNSRIIQPNKNTNQHKMYKI